MDIDRWFSGRGSDVSAVTGGGMEIGNAVPFELARAIGKAVRRMLEESR
ncbi:MAG: hypothetical protein K8T26_11055 [Lentisphaerae bacterium]|nr:hypothetical protein [Lentisphaerota bacterium]